MWATWWTWAVASLGLVILEMFAPGYIFLGFAVGAAVVALIGLGGGLGALSLPLVLVIFALASLIGYLAVRRFVPGSRGDAKIWRRDIND